MQETSPSVADKPLRLRQGPTAMRKLAKEMLEKLERKDITVGGIREIEETARKSAMSAKDLKRVEDKARERRKVVQEELLAERSVPDLFPKKHGYSKWTRRGRVRSQ